MNVYLFAYSKKKNSTAQPSLSAGTSFTVTLKEDTSVLNPVLVFNAATTGMPTPFTPSYFNYAYISAFSRYYYVTDWVNINALWECHLTVDPMASFKTAIGSESVYVERSASASNGSIIDNLYPAKTDVQISSITVTSTWSGVAPSGGCYILGVVSNSTSYHVGAVMYYALNTAGLNSLLAYLFSNNIFNAGSITEIGEGLFKSMFNPFQYIVSCTWLPHPADNYGSSQETIKIGYWDTGVTAYIVTALLDETFIEATIPSHPQISRGSFLNYAPYTRITLFCAPFGEIPIDPTFLRTGNLLRARVVIDTITGMATLRIAFRESSDISYSRKPCYETSALFGVPIQLAQVLSDYSSAIGTAAAGTVGGLAGMAMGLISATVQSAIATQAPKVATTGANGSFISFALSPDLVVEHTLLVDENNTDLGRPLMQTKTINTLSGYIKCAESHFSGACFDSEKDMINRYMVDGFFYE